MCFAQIVKNVSNAEIVRVNLVQAANPDVREENVTIAVNARYAVNVFVAMNRDATALFAKTAANAQNAEIAHV